HCFPTRRSSDLLRDAQRRGGVAVALHNKEPAQRHKGDVDDLQAKDDENVQPHGLRHSRHRRFEACSPRWAQVGSASPGAFPAAPPLERRAEWRQRGKPWRHFQNTPTAASPAWEDPPTKWTITCSIGGEPGRTIARKGGASMLELIGFLVVLWFLWEKLMTK